MIGMGTIINTAAVLVGGLLGLLLKNGVAEQVHTTLEIALHPGHKKELGLITT